MPDESTSGITVPKSVLVTILISVVAAMGTGGFYMGRQSAQLDALDNYKKANDARLTLDEAAITAANTSTNEVNNRLTRIETQLSFIITAMPSNNSSSAGSGKR